MRRRSFCYLPAPEPVRLGATPQRWPDRLRSACGCAQVCGAGGAGMGVGVVSPSPNEWSGSCGKGRGGTRPTPGGVLCFFVLRPRASPSLLSPEVRRAPHPACACVCGCAPPPITGTGRTVDAAQRASAEVRVCASAASQPCPARAQVDSAELTSEPAQLTRHNGDRSTLQALLYPGLGWVCVVGPGHPPCGRVDNSGQHPH